MSRYQASEWYLERALRSILLGSHNLNHAHSPHDIESLLAAYAQLLPMLSLALAGGDVRQRLHCEPLVPLFKLR
jgi:glutamate-1-semialdehyde 2,1-aminomutase